MFSKETLSEHPATQPLILKPHSLGSLYYNPTSSFYNYLSDVLPHLTEHLGPCTIHSSTLHIQNFRKKEFSPPWWGSLLEVRQCLGVESCGLLDPPNITFSMNVISLVAEVLHPEPSWKQSPCVFPSTHMEANTSYHHKVRSICKMGTMRLQGFEISLKFWGVRSPKHQLSSYYGACMCSENIE